MKRSMRAIILAGGLGSRLLPYTTVLPKPLMPVGDRPVLDIVVRQLKRDGFEHITISTGHLAELIEAFFGDGSKYGLRIDYFREEEPLGTVGSLSLIEGLDGEDFLVMNGDVLTDMSYAALMEAHRERDALITIAAHRRTIQFSLGVMRLDEDDESLLTGYIEKPETEFDASMGVYCFSPEAIAYLDPGAYLDFPDLVIRLVERGLPVRAHHQECFWLDVGRPEDYALAQDEFERLRSTLLPEGSH
jgi:NDP-sugar pyrophosphorylase family protein